MARSTSLYGTQSIRGHPINGTSLGEHRRQSAGGTPVLLKCSKDGRTVSVEALGKHHGVTPEPCKDGGCPELASLKTCPSERGCPGDPGVVTNQGPSASVDDPVDTLGIAGVISPERRASPPVTSASPPVSATSPTIRTESPMVRTSSPAGPVRMSSSQGLSCSAESLGSGPRPPPSPGSRDSVIL